MRGKVAAQPGFDFSEQAAFDVGAIDLGTATPAVCSRGHRLPPGVVGCPTCLQIEGEKVERDRNARMVLSAARAIIDGGPEAPILCAGVAGLLHFIPAAGEKRSFCGELVNPKNVLRKDFRAIDRMPGQACKACREHIGL